MPEIKYNPKLWVYSLSLLHSNNNKNNIYIYIYIYTYINIIYTSQIILYYSLLWDYFHEYKTLALLEIIKRKHGSKYRKILKHYKEL